MKAPNRREIQAINAARHDERERCIEAVEWFSNVERFTAADIVKRIREMPCANRGQP